MAAQAGLCLALSETPEDTFCRVVAHIYRRLPPKEADKWKQQHIMQLKQQQKKKT